MAGIKETKDQLRKEILELYKRFTVSKPEEIFSSEENQAQLHVYADVAADLAKKIEALACLVSVEEEKPVIVPLVPEIQTPEIIAPVIVPVVEKIIPPVTENKHPDIVQSPPSQGGKNFPDLKSFIGFNEKLMFVRSLFNSEGTDYENAIAQINNCHSFREAEAVLQNLSTTYKWSPETEPVQIFYSIVKRRFV